MKRLTLLAGLRLIFILSVLVMPSACMEGEDYDSLDMLDKIRRLDGVTVTEINPSNNYHRAFQIDIQQPVDHNNPNGPKFSQRVYLSHVDEDLPLVFAPNGYGSSPSAGQEIAGILQTNCLSVTHRYFFDARPDPMNWEYLTIQQAAADHHRIVQLFKKIYKGKWISSGASKSGLTALFHKRYYPEDVDATIAYVAPFTFGIKDQRFPLYLSEIGGSTCFSKLMQIQLYALNHRVEMLGYIDKYISTGSTVYSMDRELLLELDIMDYPFTFWQYFSIDCTSIPDTASTGAFDIFQHIMGIVPLQNFSDDNLAYFEPYVYQAITELGAPAYQTDYLTGHLKKVDPDDPGNPNYELVGPKGISYTFNNNTLPEIYEWLQENGDHIIYIYGENDPWSAGAIELPSTTDALLIMQEGANHRVKIATLDNPEIVFSTLENWLGISIGDDARKSFNSIGELPGFRLGLKNE